MYPSGYPQIIKLYLRKKGPTEGNFLLGSRGRKEECFASQITEWLFSPPRGTLGQGRNSVPGKENNTWGFREDQRQGMVLGELKIESGCWSINLGHINSTDWIVLPSFFTDARSLLLELGFSLLSLHAQDTAPNEAVMQECITREQ